MNLSLSSPAVQEQEKSQQGMNLLLLQQMYQPVLSAEGQSPGDFLTCGGCKKKFVLSDLTKFVQHKLLECTKEKTGCDSEDEEEKEQNVRHKSLGSPSVSGSGQVDDEECSRIKSEGEERDRKPSVRDNGANTVKSEPGMFTCCSCRQPQDSAWELLKHVHSAHGIRCCVESSEKLGAAAADAQKRSMPSFPPPPYPPPPPSLEPPRS